MLSVYRTLDRMRSNLISCDGDSALIWTVLRNGIILCHNYSSVIINILPEYLSSRQLSHRSFKYFHISVKRWHANKLHSISSHWQHQIFHLIDIKDLIETISCCILSNFLKFRRHFDKYVWLKLNNIQQSILSRFQRMMNALKIIWNHYIVKVWKVITSSTTRKTALINLN